MIGVHRDFNLTDQQAEGWWAPARVAADMVAALVPAGGRLADLGCGDCKLRAALVDRGVTVDYTGFDLLPQSPGVRQFDLRRDRLPCSFDVATLLGVTEYLANIGAVLCALAPYCDAVVVSHVLASARSPTADRLTQLGWVSHLGRDEFLKAVCAGGFVVERKHMTPDHRTLLIAARRHCH